MALAEYRGAHVSPTMVHFSCEGPPRVLGRAFSASSSVSRRLEAGGGVPTLPSSDFEQPTATGSAKVLTRQRAISCRMAPTFRGSPTCSCWFGRAGTS